MNSQLQTAFAPTGVLRVSINVGNPILAKRVDDRAVTGVSVDMAHALAQELGLPVELVVFESAGESVQAVIDERADVGFFAIDPKRGQEIAFTDAYVLIEGYYLVRDDSPIASNESVDQPGVRIAVGKGSAYDLHLQRTIHHAQLVAAPTSPAVFSFFVEHQLEVAAGVKQQLEKDLPKFPGHRLLPERFMVIRQAMGVAKSRGSAARAALTQFVEQQKSIGFVAQALDRHQITGATVAPLNSTTTQAVQDNDQRPRLGLMLGDPTGIGPEVAIKLLNRPQTHAEARVLVVGDHRIFQQAAKHQGFDWPVRLVTRGQKVVWPSAGTKEILMVDLNNIDPGVVTPGSADPAMGWRVGETLQVMTHMALNNEIDAVCFAPLNKGAINRGGWKYLDEHAMFADWNQHQGYYGEVNIIPMFCTFRVTSHVSLREAVDLVIPERIEGAVTLAHTVLKGLGHQTPRIGVAALNPHSGEGGLFGDEEITIIRPTLQKLTAAGLYTEGPYPSDTVFLKAKAGLLDAVVIMYHDQGQIATKLLGFSEGVTLTGGLKTIYTTPAHGTAYDIVGQNKADPGAMIKAFEVAVRLANRRRIAAPTAQSH